MAFSNSPIFPASLLSKVVQFTNTTSTSVPTSVISAQVNGCKIEQILVSNSDTVAHDVNIYINAGSTNYQIGTISIPLSSGILNGIPAVSLFKAVNSTGSTLLPLSLDANGDPYIYLDPQTSLYMQAGSSTAVTSGKTINIVAIAGAF